MITKDDHDVFLEWCRAQLSFYDAVVCLDGSSSDKTERIAHEFPERMIYLHETQFSIPSKTDHGLRRIVHQEICRRFSFENWVMCCHPDEFCYHDPHKIALKAANEGYDLISWFSLHFLPHPEDLTDWETRRKLPVYERFRHYHWSYRGNGLPWREQRLYRNGLSVFWDEHTHGSVAPHNLSHEALFHPILQHYKVLTTDLDFYQPVGMASFYKTHWEGQRYRTGLAYPVRRLEDFFVTSYPPYERCDRFDGSFKHSWNMGDEYRAQKSPALEYMKVTTS
jgi:hypothetical protein